jgi:hypothetical protein
MRSHRARRAHDGHRTSHVHEKNLGFTLGNNETVAFMAQRLDELESYATSWS